MKVTDAWLREWCNPQHLTAQEIAHLLTMAGLEVDGIESAAPEFDHVVVGKIIDIKPHPDADKLRITSVDVGKDAPLQIVCGAPNARVDIFVPTALVGATLPGDFKIKPARLRGIESNGMLCSAKELGVDEAADGLLELSSTEHNLTPGQSIRELLNLDEQIIEIDLTPNRGDCLSIRGLARELSVLTSSPFADLDIQPCHAELDDTVNIQLDNPTDCPRYIGRIIKDINPTATTPGHIAQRLTRAGIRVHSLVVDITNYVMLSLGQPMHAFDLPSLQGDIVVRRAKEDESLQLLNEKTVSFTSIQPLLITDDRGPIAIAGIMGGAETEISETSTDIFLESAFFSPLSVAGVAREFGLQTDASHRYERGVSLDVQVLAIEWATQLILEAAGGHAGPTSVYESPDNLPENPTIGLRASHINKKLGIDIESDQIDATLTSLGMQTTRNGDLWNVCAPAWRFDIQIEDDLVEEIGRIIGYENIPAHSPDIALKPPTISESKRSEKALREQLVHLGYAEIVAYSFLSADHNAIFNLHKKSIALANPISSDMSLMRTSMLPGLLKTAALNQTRQQNRGKLFDLGICFETDDEPNKALPRETTALGGIAWGGQSPETWLEKSKSTDFYSIKGDVEQILKLAHLDSAIRFLSAQADGFHPGQCAEIYHGNDYLGVVGKIHPLANKAFGLKVDCFAFELALEPLLHGKKAQYYRLPKFPASRRDIAIIIDESTEYADIEKTISQLQIPDLQSTILFDQYSDEQMGADRKSLAIGLLFQSAEETLTDEAIHAHVQQITDALASAHNAILRDS